MTSKEREALIGAHVAVANAVAKLAARPVDIGGAFARLLEARDVLDELTKPRAKKEKS